jgi:hypothetical protein
VPSSDPYAHWDEYQAFLLGEADYNCTLAVAVTAYDLFIGTPEQTNFSRQALGAGATADACPSALPLSWGQVLR